MIQEIVCDCLNVSFYAGSEEVYQTEIDAIQRLINSIPAYNQQNDVFDFLNNSRLIKLNIEGVVVQHTFLCFEQIFDNWKINYCAICEKKTHATLINDVSKLDSRLVLVNSSLLNDNHNTNSLKTDLNYSPAFGIILPKKLLNQNQNESSYCKLDRFNFNIDNMALANIQLNSSEKVKQFLYNQRINMQDRIKRYTIEENKKYDELCQNANEDKDNFIRIVESIQQRNLITNDLESFDKENMHDALIKRKSDKNMYFGLEEIETDFLKKQAISDNESFSHLKKKMNSADFDGLFDIDDIDPCAEVTSDLNDHLEDEDIDLALSDEENDIFPLQQSNIYSNDIILQESINFDESLSISRSSINPLSTEENNLRTRKSSSVVQNIPYHYQNKSRYSQQTTTPNSLPIKIPHLRSRMSDLDNDDNYKMQPGESIADSIQKLARSVRNENDIFDDRPRRRLNTGDLIKSRPILN